MANSNMDDQDVAQKTNEPEQAKKQGTAKSNPAQSGERPKTEGSGIDFLLDVPLQVSVEVGRAKMLIKDFLQMKEGGVIELDKMSDEPLDLYVNSRLIARGEAVVVNEKFGLRLIDVVSTAERLEKLR